MRIKSRCVRVDVDFECLCVFVSVCVHVFLCVRVCSCLDVEIWFFLCPCASCLTTMFSVVELISISLL